MRVLVFLSISELGFDIEFGILGLGDGVIDFTEEEWGCVGVEKALKTLERVRVSVKLLFTGRRQQSIQFYGK